MKRYLRILLATVGVAVLAACGAANFAYNRAPGFIAGEFDDAFNLTSEQADQLDQRLQVIFDRCFFCRPEREKPAERIPAGFSEFGSPSWTPIEVLVWRLRGRSERFSSESGDIRKAGE